jgi:hypothetical protein
MISSRIFFLAKFSQKPKFKIQKRSEGFQSPEVRGEKKGKNRQICILGFHCCSQDYRSMIKICTLFLILIKKPNLAKSS